MPKYNSQERWCAGTRGMGDHVLTEGGARYSKVGESEAKRFLVAEG